MACRKAYHNQGAAHGAIPNFGQVRSCGIPPKAETVRGVLLVVPAVGVGEQHRPSYRGAVLKPVGLWPRLGEAAITGAQYFPVDFGADEAEELCKPEEQ